MCIYRCVYIYTYIHLYTYVHRHTCMYIHIYIYTFIFIYTPIYEYICMYYVIINILAYRYTYKIMYIFVCICVYRCIYVDTYISHRGTSVPVWVYSYLALTSRWVFLCEVAYWCLQIYMLKIECMHGWPHFTTNNPWAFIKYQHVILAFMIWHVFLEMFVLLFSLFLHFSSSFLFPLNSRLLNLKYVFSVSFTGLGHITVQQQVTVLNVSCNSSHFI